MALAIATQPSGIINSRSPIFYKFTGLDNDYNYKIFVYINSVEYLTIDRAPNKNLEIIIDIHDILKNYLRSSIVYPTNSIITTQCILRQYSAGVLNGSISSSTTNVVLGATDYENGINYSRGVTYQAGSDPENIYLPNYGDNEYFSTWLNLVPNVKWTIDYNVYYFGGTDGFTEFFDTGYIQKIPIGYSYLQSICDIDIDKPFIFKVFSGFDLLKTTNVFPLPCNGNDLNSLTFINKYGVWDKIFITGKVSKSLSAEYETYKYNNLNYATMSYANKGTYHKFLNNSKNSLTINTGWISEGLNDKMEELFLSENVYYNDKAILITSKEMQFKTHKFDKLINYMINADYAYDKINNVK